MAAWSPERKAARLRRYMRAETARAAEGLAGGDELDFRRPLHAQARSLKELDFCHAALQTQNAWRQRGVRTGSGAALLPAHVHAAGKQCDARGGGFRPGVRGRSQEVAPALRKEAQSSEAEHQASSEDRKIGAGAVLWGAIGRQGISGGGTGWCEASGGRFALGPCEKGGLCVAEGKPRCACRRRAVEQRAKAGVLRLGEGAVGLC